MATPDIRIRLSAEGIQEVVAAFQKVSTESGKIGKKGAGGFGVLSQSIKGVTGILGSLGIALGVGAFTNFVSGAIKSAAAAADMAESVGASVTNLSALEAAGSQAGAGAEQIQKGLIRLNKGLDDLAAKSPGAVAAFGRIGLSIDDFDGKDAAESFVLVANKLGQLKDGYAKTAIAEELFGKGGARLIPLLNSIANDSMESIVEAGKRMGVVITDEAVASVKALDDQVGLLGQAAKVTGVTFATGFAPFVRDALAGVQSFLAQNADTWREWGKIIGFVAAFVLDVVTTLVDTLVLLVERIGITISNIGTAAVAATKGDFGAAADAFSKGAAKQRTLEDAYLARLRSRKFGIGVSGNVEPKPAPTGVRLPVEDGTKARIARLKAEQAIAANALTLQKANAKSQAEASQQEFDQGIIGIREYYDRRRAAISAGATAELEVLTAARRAADAIDDPSQRLAELDRIAVQQRATILGTVADQAALYIEQKKAVENLGREKIRIEEEVAAARGDTHARDLREIQDRVAALRKNLLATGLPPEDRLPQEQDLEQALTAQLRFNEALKAGQQALADLALDRADIERDVARGMLTQLQGQSAIVGLERDRVPVLKAIADQVTETAAATGSPESIRQARELAGSVDEVSTAAERAALSLGDVFQTLETSSIGALFDFFNEGIDSVHGFEDAISQMVESVLKDLRRLASQALATELVKGGAKAAGTAFDFARILFGGSPGFAGGGLFRGRGTGTSDSNLIRVSDKEYIVPARRVAEPGVLPLLHHIRRFGLPEAFRDLKSLKPIPHTPRGNRFADGGLVDASAFSSPGASTFSGSLEVSLSPDLFIRQFRTPEIEREVFRILVKNRRAAGRLSAQ